MKGDGNQQDYGARIYDPRIGKFLSVDPLANKFPGYANYSFAKNSPLIFIDKDGEEASYPPFWIKMRMLIFGGNYELTSNAFLQMARGHNIPEKNYTRHGRIFEDAVLNSTGLTNSKVDIYPYPNTNPNKYFTPDALETISVVREPFKPSRKIYTFPNALLTDAKFTTKSEVPLNSEFNSDQIRGFIDHLSTVGGVTENGVPTGRTASDYGMATLVLITPWDVEISKEIINYAKEKNVSVFQRVAVHDDFEFYGAHRIDIKDHKIKVSPAFKLYQAESKVPGFDSRDANFLGTQDASGKSVEPNWDKK